ncbi:hypothetical protein [Bacillus altitudinis]|uniref:hypothetical protein n=1 Tax=Bacillus altitudinis TaxID=293387 RepID=UPI002100E1A7|nr:hypothetical protein [Bacillus altitudinis]UTV34849.1 hypothetical protein NM966_19845 [Bacillus altitudinis]
MSEKLNKAEEELRSFIFEKEMISTEIKKKKAEVERELIENASITISTLDEVDKWTVRVYLDELVIKLKSLYNM